MKIKSIKSIPRFIGEYFNNGILNEKDIKDFSYILKNNIFCLLDDSKFIASLENKPSFVDFYIDKSKLDESYNCKYEDELDLPKSIYNEIYSVETESGNIVNVTINFDSEFDCLILNIED